MGCDHLFLHLDHESTPLVLICVRDPSHAFWRSGRMDLAACAFLLYKRGLHIFLARELAAIITFKSSLSEKTMDNYNNIGFDALLAAASEAESSLTVPGTPASRACNDAPDLQAALARMSETFSSQLATITSQMVTVFERLRRVESGPSTVVNSTPAHQTNNHDSESHATPVSERSTSSIPWCDRELTSHHQTTWSSGQTRSQNWMETTLGANSTRYPRRLSRCSPRHSASQSRTPPGGDGAECMACRRATPLSVQNWTAR